jgi:hypothetical protein
MSCANPLTRGILLASRETTAKMDPLRADQVNEAQVISSLAHLSQTNSKRSSLLRRASTLGVSFLHRAHVASSTGLFALRSDDEGHRTPPRTRRDAQRRLRLPQALQ